MPGRNLLFLATTMNTLPRPARRASLRHHAAAAGACLAPTPLTVKFRTKTVDCFHNRPTKIHTRRNHKHYARSPGRHHRAHPVRLTAVHNVHIIEVLRGVRYLEVHDNELLKKTMDSVNST